MPEKNVLIAFGSPFDYAALQTHFQRQPGTNYFLSVASAHRTPETVERHAHTMQYDGIVAGAGMCNALKDAYLKECGNAVLVALPVRDSRTGGLSSVLSSSEMPPGYPVAMSQADNLGAAVAFVNYALKGGFDAVRLSCDSDADSRKVCDEAVNMFNELGVSVTTDRSSRAIDVVAYTGPRLLYDFGPCIASFASPLRNEAVLFKYLGRLRAYPFAVHTGVADGKNLALYASKIIARNNPAVGERINRQREEGRKKYDNFRELREL
ncbi:MAG: AIR carboxylase family protein [Candidatus Aenigmarchaeota archaeon]|nr:AIR carboxylase family protein [Candidatus Aenigmarchaeota archaeon]